MLDTAVGTVINFPLNFMLIWLAREIELTVLQTSVMMSVIFIVLAIVRKTTIRCVFHDQYKKRCTNHTNIT